MKKTDRGTTLTNLSSIQSIANIQTVHKKRKLELG